MIETLKTKELSEILYNFYVALVEINDAEVMEINFTIGYDSENITALALDIDFSVPPVECGFKDGWGLNFSNLKDFCNKNNINFGYNLYSSEDKYYEGEGSKKEVKEVQNRNYFYRINSTIYPYDNNKPFDDYNYDNKITDYTESEEFKLSSNRNEIVDIINEIVPKSNKKLEWK